MKKNSFVFALRLTAALAAVLCFAACPQAPEDPSGGKLPASSTPTAGTNAKTVTKNDVNQKKVTFTLTSANDGEWKVYASESGGVPLTGVTASFNAPRLTLTAEGEFLPIGTYYVSVTEKGKAESGRLALTVAGPPSDTPTADETTVAKTAVTQREVTFTLTSANDGEWKIYEAASGGEPLNISASFDEPYLTLTDGGDNLAAGTYYISVTETEKAESGRLALTVTAYVYDPLLMDAVLIKIKKAEIALGDLSAVDANVNLPVSDSAVRVDWSSEDTTLLSNTGVVKRPSGSNQTFTLTGTFSSVADPGVTLNRYWTVRIMRNNAPPTDYLNVRYLVVDGELVNTAVSGSFYTPTLQGTAAVAYDDSGFGYISAGSGGYIDLGEKIGHLMRKPEWTIEFFVYAASDAGTMVHFANDGNLTSTTATGTRGNFWFKNPALNIYAANNGANTGNRITSGDSLGLGTSRLNQWVHLMLVKSAGGGINIFRNAMIAQNSRSTDFSRLSDNAIFGAADDLTWPLQFAYLGKSAFADVSSMSAADKAGMANGRFYDFRMYSKALLPHNATNGNTSSDNVYTVGRDRADSMNNGSGDPGNPNDGDNGGGGDPGDPGDPGGPGDTVGPGSGDTMPTSPVDPDWFPAATQFTIIDKTSNSITNTDVGAGMQVTNAVITWRVRSDTQLYAVWRDGAWLKNTPGNKIEDYDLTPGQTYAYTVVGYYGDTVTAVSVPVAVIPYVTTSSVYWRHNFITDTRTTVGSGPTGGGGSTGATSYTDSQGRTYTFRMQSSGSGASSTRSFQYQRNGGSWTTMQVTDVDGSTKISIGTWTGNVNGHPNNTAYVQGDAWDSGATANQGIGTEGTHWYDLYDMQKRVLICHRKSSGNYNLAHLMIVHCYVNNGAPYAEVTYSGRPFGKQSRDQRGIFIDGKPYALCSALTAQNWFELDAQWREPIIPAQLEHFTGLGNALETPDMFRMGDLLYFGASQQNGWYPSQTRFSTAAAIDGEWKPMGELGQAAGFGAQFNRFESHRMNNGQYAVVLRSYRWAANWSGIAKESSSPQRAAIISINGSFMAAEFFPNMAFHPAHGLIGIRSGRAVSLGKPVTAPSNRSQTNLWAITDGADHKDSVSRYIMNAKPTELTVDLGTSHKLNGMALSTHQGYGSDVSYQFVLHGSQNNSTWEAIELRTNGTVKDTNANGWPGFVPLDIPTDNPYRYVRLTVNAVKDSRHSDEDKSTWDWGTGIYELYLYGVESN